MKDPEFQTTSDHRGGTDSIELFLPRSPYFPVCILLLLFVPLLFAGCLPPEHSPTPNTDLPFCVLDPACTDILSVGHRGTYVWGPENTIASLHLAYRMGADFVEIDVRETADGHLVLMHDETVNRTTDGRGRVDGMTLGEIKTLWVISLNPDVPNQRVPTLEEALDYCRGKLCVDVDPKIDDVENIAEAVEAARMLEQVMILTKGVDKGHRMQAVVPEIVLMARCDTYDEVAAFMEELDPPIYEVDFLIMGQVEELIHDRGAKMFVDALGYFDVLGLAGYQILVCAGADIIQTDNLTFLVPYLRWLNGWPDF